MKQYFFNHALITTEPTEKGEKDLDVFHPSYRVKRINKQPLQAFQPDRSMYSLGRRRGQDVDQHMNLDDTMEGDIFLDILQNEKAGLITVQITLNKDDQDKFYEELQSLYIEPENNNDIIKQWNIMRKEILSRLFDALIPEVKKELRNQLREAAENWVIKRCQEAYR